MRIIVGDKTADSTFEVKDRATGKLNKSLEISFMNLNEKILRSRKLRRFLSHDIGIDLGTEHPRLYARAGNHH